MKSIAEKIIMIRSRFPQKKIVFVSGNFNIVHPGHLRLINFAKSCGDVLVVGLFRDDSPGVIVSFDDRRAGLIGLESVDDVLALDANNLLTVISDLKPDVVVKGKEHEPFSNPERDLVISYGGHFIFSAGEATFSSRDLIRRELANPLSVPLRSDDGFLSKHKSGREQLLAFLKAFSGLKICVLGDLIVDEYIYCDPLGLSQEDPTIVVTPIENRVFVGGAGIVAAHLKGLGAETTFFSVVGRDPIAEQASRLLSSFGVHHDFIFDTSRPTTLKQRFRANNKTLLRVSHLRSHDIEEEHQVEMLSRFESTLAKVDGVIFSDFNYGCLPQSLVEGAIRLCLDKGVPFFADSQASSQVGDVSRFRHADLLSATEREARLAMNDFRSGLQHIANGLLTKSDATGMLLKLGAEGLLALESKPEFRTDELGAFNLNAVDVAGAGDALLAAASLTRLSGGSVWEAAYLGSVAAALQVSRMGNLPLALNDLVREVSDFAAFKADQ
jgi:rfaE bifunctional protein kinase chain/domain